MQRAHGARSHPPAQELRECCGLQAEDGLQVILQEKCQAAAPLPKQPAAFSSPPNGEMKSWAPCCCREGIGTAPTVLQGAWLPRGACILATSCLGGRRKWVAHHVLRTSCTGREGAAVVGSWGNGGARCRNRLSPQQDVARLGARGRAALQGGSAHRSQLHRQGFLVPQCVWA